MRILLSLRNQSPTYLSDLCRHRQYPAGKLAAQTNLQPLFESVPFSTCLKHLDPEPQFLKHNRTQSQRKLILLLPPLHDCNVRLQLRGLRHHVRIQQVVQNSTFRGFHFNRGNSTSTPSSGGYRNASQSRFPDASPTTGRLTATEVRVRRANSSSVIRHKSLLSLVPPSCGSFVLGLVQNRAKLLPSPPPRPNSPSHTPL